MFQEGGCSVPVAVNSNMQGEKVLYFVTFSASVLDLFASN